jgi:RHS repeat-associated protein
MQSAEVQALSESLLAATPQLSEKPRLGFESKKTTGKPGSSVCNFTVTLGLRATVVENGVRKTYRARYYNPTTGRFLSEDPIGFQGGFNLYAYANENPLRFNDPFGTCAAAAKANPCLQAALEHAVEAFMIGLMAALIFGALAGGLLMFGFITSEIIILAAYTSLLEAMVTGGLMTMVAELPLIYGAGLLGGLYGAWVCH